MHPAYAILLILLLGAGRPHAQVCKSGAPGERIAYAGYLDAEAKWRISVGLDDGLPEYQRVAFRDAMTRWNAKSIRTGIVLEETRRNVELADLIVFYSHSGVYSGPCAAYRTDSAVIWINAINMAFAESNPGAAASVYAHEIGHFLGLDHDFGSTIMREPLRGTVTAGKPLKT